MEISFNDVVSETILMRFGDAPAGGLLVCTLDDIVAEKLRAILQQVIRNRTRPQDVYDVARAFRNDRNRLDLDKIRIYLRAKSEARGIDARRDSFNGATRALAHVGYSEMREDLGPEFIEFDEAWRAVLALVDLIFGEG